MRGRNGDASEGFGQKRIGQQPGRAGQRRAQAEDTDQPVETQAQDAVGAAAGAQDALAEAPERMGGCRVGQRLQQPFPQTRMGEAAEIAGDGVRFAILRREVTPGAVGGGNEKDALHPLAQFLQGAALRRAVEQVGKERGPFEVRHPLAGGRGRRRTGGVRRKYDHFEKIPKICSKGKFSYFKSS